MYYIQFEENWNRICKSNLVNVICFAFNLNLLLIKHQLQLRDIDEACYKMHACRLRACVHKIFLALHVPFHTKDYSPIRKRNCSLL